MFKLICVLFNLKHIQPLHGEKELQAAGQGQDGPCCRTHPPRPRFHSHPSDSRYASPLCPTTHSEWHHARCLLAATAGRGWLLESWTFCPCHPTPAVTGRRHHLLFHLPPGTPVAPARGKLGAPAEAQRPATRQAGPLLHPPEPEGGAVTASEAVLSMQEFLGLI